MTAVNPSSAYHGARKKECPMGLTVEVLNDLEASNLQAASQAALMENNAIALIELLEMLWSCNLEGANTVIDAVLQRLPGCSCARALKPSPPDVQRVAGAPGQSADNGPCHAPASTCTPPAEPVPLCTQPPCCCCAMPDGRRA